MKIETVEEKDPMEDFSDLSTGIDESDPIEEPEFEDAVKIWDVDLHEAAQDLKKHGLWFDMGPRFGGMELRIRPFWVEAIQLKRNAVEKQFRMKEGLRDNEETPDKYQIPLNRVSALMAITGCRAQMSHEGKTIQLTDADPADRVRFVLKPRIDKSMPFLLAIIDRNKEMERKKDAEVVKLGEDFVYGRLESVGWGD